MLPTRLGIQQGDAQSCGNQHLCIRDTTVLYPQKTVLQGRIEWRSVMIAQSNTSPKIDPSAIVFW
jgi:hypothetical protein